MIGSWFESGESINPEVAFYQSFGDKILPKQVYYDAQKDGVDLRKSFGADILKQSLSTTTGGTGTAGYALIPIYVDAEIVDLTRKQTPLVELIPRRAVKGTTYDFNQITAKSGAKWKLEDASLDVDTDTYDRASVPIKYGYSVGRVTGPAVAGMRGYVDALAQDLRVKTIALRELEENTIINGDAATYATEFSGFSVAISNNSRSLTSAKPTIADMRTENDTIFNDSGMNDLNVMDAPTHSYFKGLLMEFQSYIDESENLPFGIAGSYSIDGVNMVKSRFLTAASGSRVIYCLTRASWEMAVLQDATYEELAKTNDSSKFMIKIYEALACKADKFNSKLTSVG